MKKIKFLIPVLLSLCAGCSATRPIGVIGNVRFYEVKSRSIAGPNITALVVQNTEDTNQVSIQSVIGGSALGPAIVSAVGNTGAAAAFGLSLRPSSEVNSLNAESDSGATANADASANAGATANSGSTVNNPTCTPPKPPVCKPAPPVCKPVRSPKHH